MTKISLSSDYYFFLYSYFVLEHLQQFIYFPCFILEHVLLRPGAILASSWGNPVLHHGAPSLFFLYFSSFTSWVFIAVTTTHFFSCEFSVLPLLTKYPVAIPTRYTVKLLNCFFFSISN